MGFKWQHPEWLWIGPALFTAVLLAAILFHRWRSGIWKKLGLEEQGGTLATGAKGSMRFFTRYTLLALALGCAGLSVANLQMSGQKQTIQRQGTDIVFALDVSRSMLAEDIAPNRLEKSKLLISKAIDRLGGDRVGVVVYAGSAYPALPITTDYAAAKMALSNADPDQVPSQGTNLSDALEFAQDYFNPLSPAGRFIIVLTDGEDHEFSKAPIDPELSVNILVVGVGTAAGGPIPIEKGRNGTTFKKDKSGEVVITRRDDAVLQKITNVLDAQFVDGNIIESALQNISSFIAEGEKSDIQEEISMNYDSQFMWFLYPSLFFLLLYLLLPQRVRVAAMIVAMLGLNSVEGQNLHAYGQEVRKGNEAYENEQWEDAVEAYDAASELQPDAFIPKFNKGTALMQKGDMEGAAQALRSASQLTEDELQQSDALYNLGNVLMDDGKFEEATSAYIESLKRNPNRPDAIYNLNRALEQVKKQEKQQEQEQEGQQQEKQQEQEQEREQEKEQEKSDNPNEQPQEEQEDQKNSKKDQDQQGDGDKGEQDPGQQPQDDDQGKEVEQNKPEEGGESTAKMTPEEIKGLLEAIQRAEEKTAEKINAKKVKGGKKSGEKDW